MFRMRLRRTLSVKMIQTLAQLIEESIKFDKLHFVKATLDWYKFETPAMDPNNPPVEDIHSTKSTETDWKLDKGAQWVIWCLSFVCRVPNLGTEDYDGGIGWWCVGGNSYVPLLWPNQPSQHPRMWPTIQKHSNHAFNHHVSWHEINAN